MYYEPYEDERPRWWKSTAAGVVAVLVLLAVFAFWQLRPGSGSSGDAVSTSSLVDTPTSSDHTSTTSSDHTSTTSSTPSTTSVPAVVDVTTSATSVVESLSTTTTATTGVGSVVSATSETSLPPASTPPPAPYPTGPDGTPLPIVVIFDTDTITVSGQVPSQPARDRLGALAIANSQFPDAALIDNMVINPAVPISVGVRVIELNSARFPEASAQILPAHAAELDRVVTIMQALPNISVLVVGHADQRGNDVGNFAISDERARAVVNYLLYLGISPTRLASRAAGESDLLTIADDDAALALNRRTEFIFYGLLIE
jgi:outer membrane protein OmpA-like peptidoglycan-associated protein